MKFIFCSLEGTSPMLQQRFIEDEQTSKRSARSAKGKTDPLAEATGRANIVEQMEVDGKTYKGVHSINATVIPMMLKNVGGGYKVPGSRKYYKSVIPGTVFMLCEWLPILEPATGKPYRHCEVDSRSVVIPSTKGRIMHHRPRYEQWALKFLLKFNENYIPFDIIEEIMAEAGQVNGIGEFRVQKGGPFGQFIVTQFEEVVPS